MVNVGTLSWILAAVIFAVGSIFGMVLVFAVIKNMGTLLVDMKSPDEEGIVRLIFDKPIEEVNNHSLMWVKIEQRRDLRSIK